MSTPLTTPKSIEELHLIAKMYTDDCIPIEIYTSSADLLIKQARIYYKEENEEQAYVYFLKYINLLLIELSKRPGFNHLDNNDMVQACMEALEALEVLRPSIEAVHESYQLFHTDKSQPTSSPERRNSPTAMDWEPTPTRQDLGVPPPPLPPKIKINKDKAPQLPPKIRILLDQPNTDYNNNNNNRQEIIVNQLRILNIPTVIQKSFLNIARFNTSINVETCGILSGKLKNNELFVTSLLIPNQEGTSDTCITKNEEAIFDYQDKNGLLTLGWIHTHPSQTCFLSSVDLHTHCSYQLMLPEAVAIVCAPNNNPDFGVFRLTSPEGLKEITNCKATSSFHPHPDTSILYQNECQHVRLNSLSTLETVDLR
ncbi:hypothetical protein MFLAVUS_006244 [Mucor flavus]|uniref:MPN domain-containing protein n=1 Tax=Mucor flavus TaxID=439312 RepID=A0ABP9Z0Z3_9FUNG